MATTTSCCWQPRPLQPQPRLPNGPLAPAEGREAGIMAPLPAEIEEAVIGLCEFCVLREEKGLVRCTVTIYIQSSDPTNLRTSSA